MLMLGFEIPDESEAVPTDSPCGKCGDCRHFSHCDCIDRNEFVRFTGAEPDSLENVGMCYWYGMLTVDECVPRDDDCFEP